MYDAETVTTTIHQLQTLGSATVRFGRVKRIAARRLTRAHLALADRPEVARQATDALNGIAQVLTAQLGCDVSFQASLNHVAVNPFTGLSRYSAFALLELSPQGAPAVLELDLGTVSALLQRVAGMKGTLGLPFNFTRIEEAALGWVLLVCLEALRANEFTHQRFGARLLGLMRERSQVIEVIDCQQKYVAVDLKASLGDSRGQLRLLLPAHALQRSVSELPVELPTALADEVGAATVAARIFTGKTVLDAADLQQLERGDVVRLQNLRRPGGVLDGDTRIATASFELFGALANHQFTLTGANTRALSKEPSMSFGKADAAMPALPVEVEVELTRLRLPVSQLATLKAGAVLPLHINSSEPVVLRIGDRAVARAELVDIDGEVGARIITLLK